jgi:type I restriction enzyme S subunit
MIDKVAKLGEVATFLNGGTPDRSVTRYYEGSIPWITSADLSEEEVKCAPKTGHKITNL